MTDNFEDVINRRGTNSLKWQKYPQDVLPLWVADMDFSAPDPILAALQHKVDQRIFGYEMPSPQLMETVADRLKKLYGWQVQPESIVATPGVVAGFNLAARALCEPGQGLLIQPPVYPPFFDVDKNAGLIRQEALLRLSVDGKTLSYSIDMDCFQQAIHSGGVRTGMFLLCNPHNPTGQAYSRGDLTRMAEICLNKDVFICSDEIHSELLPGGVQHIPIASLDLEIEQHSITLIAPSKTFNVPGLFCGFAIIPNKELMERYKKQMERAAMHVSSFGLAAALVAYSGECDGWLKALNLCLRGNRDFLVNVIRNDFDGIKTTVPAATYLAWLDCNELARSGRVDGTPYEFFLKQAKVALNDGCYFGAGGEGFVRLNFGCPRKTLEEALARMKTSLAA